MDITCASDVVELGTPVGVSSHPANDMYLPGHCGRMRGLEGVDAIGARRDGGGVHDVLVPLLAGYQPLDVTGPHEVFETATNLLTRGRGAGGYAVRLAAATPGAVAVR
jgi:hypothetical protein